MSDLAYLSTPYSKFPGGMPLAFFKAADIAAQLLKSGAPVYSPIAHCHPIALFGNINPLDHSIWIPLDELMMRRCDSLIVVHMDGWQESKGMAHEIEAFTRAGKPIYDMPDITTGELVRRPDTGPPHDDCQRDQGWPHPNSAIVE